MWYVTFWNANYGAQVRGGEGGLNQTICVYENIARIANAVQVAI